VTSVVAAFMRFETKVLQIRVNRSGPGWRGHTSSALDFHAVPSDLLVEEVCHRHPLASHTTSFCSASGQGLPRSCLTPLCFEPDAPVRHLDVVEHGGSLETCQAGLWEVSSAIRREGPRYRRARLPAHRSLRA